METGISIGNKMAKETIEGLKEVISTIFKVGHECHMEQETIRKALGVLATVAEVKYTTVEGCNIDSSKKVYVDTESCK